MSFLRRLFTLGRDETYDRAMCYYNNCQYKEAIEDFDRVIEAKQGKSRLYGELALFYKSQAYRNFGIIHMHEGRFAEAILDFKMALDILPDSTILHTYLGICYNNVSRFNNAVFEFQKVVSDKEGDVQARIRLALALRNQGLHDRAKEELRIAIKSSPRHADLRYFLGLVLCSDNEYKDAIEEFKNALEINPAYMDALSKLGFSYVLDGDFKKAAGVFNEVKGFLPHNETISSVLKMLEQGAAGESLKAMAKEELLKAITISLSLVPFASPHISKEDKGLCNTLAYIYKQVLKDHPNYADIHFKLAQVYANEQRNDEAIEEFSEALKINPDFIQARINIGFLYKDMKRPEEAAREFDYVIKKGFNSPVVAFDLGLIYKKLDRKEEARMAFQKALEFDPNFKEAAKELEGLPA